MINYKPLPLERELAGLDDAAVESVLKRNREALRRCPGFQLVIKAFRDLEADTVGRLQSSQGQIERLAGRLDALNFLRASVMRDEAVWENTATEEGLPEEYE